MGILSSILKISVGSGKNVESAVATPIARSSRSSNKKNSIGSSKTLYCSNCRKSTTHINVDDEEWKCSDCGTMRDED